MKECVDVERVLAGAIYTLVSSRMHTRKLPSVKTANFRRIPIILVVSTASIPAPCRLESVVSHVSVCIRNKTVSESIEDLDATF